MMCEIENTPPVLIFVLKDSQDGPRWVAQHTNPKTQTNLILYLYMTTPITLLKYCQELEKKTYIECTDVYDAISKIHDCTNRTPLIRYDGDTPSNYMA